MGERLSWNEAESVVRAYRAAHGLTMDVDVATLARTLGTDVAEVRRLAGRKPRFVDRSGALSAGLALAVVALSAITFGPALLAHRSARTAEMVAPPAPAMIILADPDGQPIVLDGDDLKTGSVPTLWSYPADEKPNL